MTVSELAEKLRAMPADAEITILYDGGYAGCGIKDVWLEEKDDDYALRWEAGDVVLRTDQ